MECKIYIYIRLKYATAVNKLKHHHGYLAYSSTAPASTLLVTNIDFTPAALLLLFVFVVIVVCFGVWLVGLFVVVLVLLLMLF